MPGHQFQGGQKRTTTSYIYKRDVSRTSIPFRHNANDHFPMVSRVLVHALFCVSLRPPPCPNITHISLPVWCFFSVRGRCQSQSQSQSQSEKRFVTCVCFACCLITMRGEGSIHLPCCHTHGWSFAWWHRKWSKGVFFWKIYVWPTCAPLWDIGVWGYGASKTREMVSKQAQNTYPTGQDWVPVLC